MEDVFPVPLWEVDLRHDQRGREQDTRGDPAPPAHEWDERNEPDQELGRQHLAERDERAEARGRIADEALADGRPPREGDPQRKQHEDLDRARQRGDPALAAEVQRAVRRDHVRVRERREQ